MIRQLSAIVLNELRVLLRERTFILLLGVFLLMTLFSSYIGWSTKTTILAVYKASVFSLRQAGVAKIPPNPFIGIPALSIFRNMIIYVFLIGSLLAIVMGHRVFIRERKSGVVQLIFSKPVRKQTFILGKISAVIITLFLIVLITFLISIISTRLIPHQQLSGLAIEKLALFYLTSLLYMLIFAMLGCWAAAVFETESSALLVPIVVWVVVTFVLPELATGQNPVALLNPTNIAAVTPHVAFFDTMGVWLSPISIEQQYTGIAQPLLETQKQFQSLSIFTILTQNGKLLLALLVYFFLALILNCYALVTYKVTRDKLYE
ncbi:MAG: ABC transporter permease [Patescibacteria group bacterium]|nr:ABC transporter permease [Patescibacteria group bacterium]